MSPLIVISETRSPVFFSMGTCPLSLERQPGRPPPSLLTPPSPPSTELVHVLRGKKVLFLFLPPEPRERDRSPISFFRCYFPPYFEIDVFRFSFRSSVFKRALIIWLHCRASLRLFASPHPPPHLAIEGHFFIFLRRLTGEQIARALSDLFFPFRALAVSAEASASFQLDLHGT